MSLLSLKCIYQHYQKLLLCTPEIGLVLALASGLFFQNCNAKQRFRAERVVTALCCWVPLKINVTFITTPGLLLDDNSYCLNSFRHYSQQTAAPVEWCNLHYFTG